jgi:hypothetical protein
MYTFSSRLKTFAFVLMALGFLGIAYGFYMAPKTTTEVEAILDKEAAEHHGSHAETEAHGSTSETNKASTPKVETDQYRSNHATMSDSVHADTIAIASMTSGNGDDQLGKENTANSADKATAVKKTESENAHESHEKHLEHVLHQMQNKPWAALYVACIFIMLISLGVLAFYAIQQVAQAGWSPVLFRVMQGISAYLPVGSIVFFVLLVLSGLHFNHLFVWMTEGIGVVGHENYDKLVANKLGYLNVPAWLIRAAIFLIGWNLYHYFSRKNCLLQDDAKDNVYFKKNFNISAGFLVFFIVTESIMSWDWIMSVDPHWFSTLFGWYVFSSFFVSGITVIALVAVYMKSRGFLEYVNTSHIHDLAKFMFGMSIFWTYLWFSQFMLIWYSNIPEEVTYFITRIEDYNLPFFGMVVMNFVFPVLILINSDFKRLTWIIAMAGVVILLGHYVDFFVMIMPATVGDRWFIGIPEVGSLLFFIGLFIFVVFTAMTKSPLLPKRHPLIEESKHFHY